MKKLLYLISFLPSLLFAGFSTDNLVATSTFTLRTSTMVINGTTYYWRAGTGNSGECLTTDGAVTPALTFAACGGGSSGTTIRVEDQGAFTVNTSTLNFSLGLLATNDVGEGKVTLNPSSFLGPQSWSDGIADTSITVTYNVNAGTPPEWTYSDDRIETLNDLALPDLDPSRPLKTNGTQVITTGLIDLSNTTDEVTGILPGANLGSGSTNYIQNTDTLQSGSTFYVSSGTASTFNITNGNIESVLIGTSVISNMYANFGSAFLVPYLDGTNKFKTDPTFLYADFASILYAPNILGTAQMGAFNGATVVMYDNDSTNFVGIKSSAVVTSNNTYIWPASPGTAGQAILTDGLNNLYFDTVAGGGGGASSLEVFSNFDGTRSSPTASISVGDSLKLSVTGSTAVISVDFSSVASRGDAILNQSTLQSGATFYVSSGSVNGQLTNYGQIVSRVPFSTGPPMVVISSFMVGNFNSHYVSSRTIGTSGASIPLLNTANSWSNSQNFSGSGEIRFDDTLVDIPNVIFPSAGGSAKFALLNNFSTYADDTLSIYDTSGGGSVADFLISGAFINVDTTFSSGIQVNGNIIGGAAVVATGITEINGGVRHLSSTTATISVDQNNYNLPTRSFVRISSNATRTITGFAATGSNGFDGNEKLIVNVGTNTIILANESASSTAANRIVTGIGADFILTSSSTVKTIYDATTQRWRLY